MTAAMKTTLTHGRVLPGAFALGHILLALLLCSSAWAAQPYRDIRKAIGAGPLYPAQPETLVNTLYRLYEGAAKRPEGQKMAACIVPHSAYGLSGKVAAQAFAQLSPGDYKRVVVLGASTATSFQGCSVPSVDAFQTPLGYVPVDKKAVEMVTRSSLFSTRSVRYRPSEQHPPLHEIEPSIELTLPFLQERLGNFSLVPIVVGDLRDADNKLSDAVYLNVAESIGSILDENTLLVVTAEFTHFGAEFKYTPFADNILPNIKQLDDEVFQTVINRDFPAFHAYLERTKNPLVGVEGLGVLMKLLTSGVKGTLLGYDTSGQLLKTPNHSVSYASFGFYYPTPTPAPTAPPPEPAKP